MTDEWSEGLDADPQGAHVLAGYQAVCGAEHGVGAWAGPERETYEDAQADMAGHLEENPEHADLCSVRGSGL